MSVFEKLLKKYGQSMDSNNVMLPPKSEEEEVLVELPKDSATPVIEDIDPENVKHKFYQYDPEEAEKIRKELQMMEDLKKGYLGEESKAGFEAKTVPPGKRAAILLRACHSYSKLVKK